jgi:hypothetical protein
MLNWMKHWRRDRPTGLRFDAPSPETAPPRGMTGKYVKLYTYLQGRYADTVVLTLAEIEDLLGFSLPDQARLRNDWWTDIRTAGHSDSWILARRTAVPNLLAKTVVFERAASHA